MKKVVLFTTLAASSLAAQATTVEETVVTATRTNQSIADTLAPTYLVTREDILKYQTSNIAEILNRLPGVQVNQTGGDGSNTSVFIRGTNSNHVLILVNGQRINSATLGTSAIQHISPEQIERIEVVSGPRASLYGSDAVGGVINIITTNPIDSQEAFIKVAAGDLGKSEVAISYQAAFGQEDFRTTVSLGAGHKETKDFNRTYISTGANSDDDNYTNYTRFFNVDQALGGDVNIGINAFKSRGATEYDNSCTNSSTYVTEQCQPITHFTVYNIGFYTEYRFEDLMTLSFDYSESKDRSETTDLLLADPSTVFGGDSFFQTTRDSYSLQFDFNLAEGQLFTFGFDHYEDNVDSLIRTVDIAFTPIISPHLDENGDPIESRDNTAGFIQYQGQFDIVSLAISLRQDDNEAFGKAETGNFALGFDLDDSHQLIISYGEAFKAPTFNDLYWPDPYGPGNPELEPEQSENIELSASGSYAQWKWTANIYQNEITDLIQWQPVPASPLFAWSPYNVASVEIQGIEFIVEADVNEWHIASSLAHTRAINEDTDNELLRRPRNSLRLDLDREVGIFGIGFSVLANGASYNDTANTDELGGYTTVDFRLSAQATNSLKYQVRIANMFDKEYTTQSDSRLGDYATEGRTVLFSIVYNPQF